MHFTDRCWSPEEIRVVDRYVRAVQRGRYRSPRQGAVAYLQDLERLRRRYPGAGWLKRRRTLSAVEHKIVRRPQHLSGLLPTRLWWPQEIRRLDRFVLGLTAGRYRSVTDAARSYMQETARLRGRRPRVPWLAVRRSPAAVGQMIEVRAHAIGRWPGTDWTPEEDKIAERCGRGIARGEFRGLHQAALACQQELACLYRSQPRTRRFAVRRPYGGVFARVRRWARKAGLPQQLGRWTAREEAILDRYARALFRGRYADATEAARACQICLELLRRKHPSAEWLPVPRRLKPIWARLCRRAHALKQPWPHTEWTHWEDRIVDRYARAFLSGRFPSIAAAANGCLRRLGQAPAPGRCPAAAARHAAKPRTRSSVNERVRARTVRLGRPKRPRRSRAELQAEARGVAS